MGKGKSTPDLFQTVRPIFYLKSKKPYIIFCLEQMRHLSKLWSTVLSLMTYSGLLDCGGIYTMCCNDIPKTAYQQINYRVNSLYVDYESSDRKISMALIYDCKCEFQIIYAIWKYNVTMHAQKYFDHRNISIIPNAIDQNCKLLVSAIATTLLAKWRKRFFPLWIFSHFNHMIRIILCFYPSSICHKIYMVSIWIATLS